ncbi:MAG: hypothetical protein ACRENU_00905 [Gemmatimonadaceae bacterium]
MNKVGHVVVGIACVAGTLFQACSGPTTPGFPPNAVPISPLAPYSLWWSVTEQCSGVSGVRGVVSWFVVPGASTFLVAGREYHGFWFPETKSLVIAEQALLEGDLVRHEMLHALVGTGHDRGYFVEACDGVVACVEQCFEEAGGPAVPGLTAPIVTLDNIDVALRVEPVTPSITDGDGWIAISVTASNPNSADVWAELDPIPPDSLFAISFGYVLECITSCQGIVGSAYEFIEGSRFGFVGAAARRRVFDRHLSTGTYSVRAIFNSDTTPPVTFSVTP